MPTDRGAEQGDVDGPLERSLALGMVATETRERTAAPHGLVLTVLQNYSDCKQTTEPECRNQPTSSLAGADRLRCTDHGDMMCHPILVLPFLQDFDIANARVRAERNPLKTEVIYHVNDLDAAPPEWRIGDVQNMAKTSAVADGSTTPGVAVGPRQYIVDQLLGQSRRRSQLCQDPQTELALLRESRGSQPHQPHPAGSWPQTILQEQRAAEIYDEVGQRSLERPFPGLSMTQATLSAGQSEIGYKRARVIEAPAHLGALKAATPKGRKQLTGAGSFPLWRSGVLGHNVLDPWTTLEKW